MHWFKIHHGYNADAKLGMIAHKLKIPRAHINAIFLDMIEHASRHNDRGSITNYDPEVAAFNLGLDQEEVSNALLSLRNGGLTDGQRILNWDKYQSPIDHTNAERQRRHRNKQKQHIDIIVTGSNALRNIDKSRIDKKERGTRFALAQLPDEWRNYCQTERPDLNPDSVFADFGDYWKSLAGSKGVKLDWFATWRGWVRRQVSRAAVKQVATKANVRTL